MELNGEHRFDAPRSVVWAALLDPRVLEATIPGCERLVEVAPGSYDVSMRVGIAALRGSYRGSVRVVDPRTEESYGLAVTGAGSPGAVNGTAFVTLSGDEASTLVRYQGELSAQGEVARLGSRPLAGAARLLIGQFFRALERYFGARAA
jgi:carbon monoxide dehydrogenase subunit G